MLCTSLESHSLLAAPSFEKSFRFMFFFPPSSDFFGFYSPLWFAHSP